MALTIPDIQSITNGSTGLDMQSVVDKTDFDALAASEDGTGVINGCTVTQHTGSDMNVSVAAGNVLINGLVVAVSAVTSLAIAAADSFDRRDIVVVNNAGTVSVVSGTDCATAGWVRTSSGLPPVKPAIPANSCLLAEVSVPNGTTQVTTAINVVDKTTLVAASPGTLLARAFYAPSTAGSYTPVVSTTGLTAIDSTNLKVTFTAPPSGDVIVKLQGFAKGGAAAATKMIFGVVSSTASPGTVVGVTGLVNLTPTATAADNGQLCVMEQLVTGLTPGTSYTWYFAASYSGTAPTIIPQGPTGATTVPTGAPAGISVYAA